MKNLTLPEKIKKYNLTSNDWFQHKHYTIITRMGIDKIQAFEGISIEFEAVKVEPEFCVIKATGKKGILTVQSFGSSKYGEKEWVNFDKPNQYGKKGKWIEHGNTSTWYVMEMAEKRAMSRVVLKITGFYELGVFGEDESEDIKEDKSTNKAPIKVASKINSVVIPTGLLNTITKGLEGVKTNKELDIYGKSNLDNIKKHPQIKVLFTSKRTQLNGK